MYRIELRLSERPDPRDALAAEVDLRPDEFQSLQVRLARPTGAREWTSATPAAIAEQPGDAPAT
jgi:hypothetical protein